MSDEVATVYVGGGHDEVCKRVYISVHKRSSTHSFKQCSSRICNSIVFTKLGLAHVSHDPGESACRDHHALSHLQLGTCPEAATRAARPPEQLGVRREAHAKNWSLHNCTRAFGERQRHWQGTWARSKLETGKRVVNRHDKRTHRGRAIRGRDAPRALTTVVPSAQLSRHAVVAGDG